MQFRIGLQNQADHGLAYFPMTHPVPKIYRVPLAPWGHWPYVHECIRETGKGLENLEKPNHLTFKNACMAIPTFYVMNWKCQTSLFNNLCIFIYLFIITVLYK